jgi:hypothetical protein
MNITKGGPHNCPGKSKADAEIGVIGVENEQYDVPQLINTSGESNSVTPVTSKSIFQC